VSSAWISGYYLLVYIIIAGFAIYDIFTKRVPDKALIFFSTVAVASPVINALNPNSSAAGQSFFPFMLSAFLGAAAGFIILLAPAIASKGGNGVGGGDIKLAAVMGFIYGPAGIIGVLLIASLLALPAGIIRKMQTKGETLRLPFVPFMALGSFAVTIVTII
jgi:prepilin signal peptidase PulO-like enzyme (type II secretory pathway)